MSVTVEQLPGESIINAIISEPFDPEQDIPAMFAQFIPLRTAIQGDVALILDVTNVISQPNAFTEMVFALANAAKGIKASKAAGLKPPITVFVGSGEMADLAAQAIEQEQYGGTKAHLCASQDDALALVREKLNFLSDSDRQRLLRGTASEVFGFA